MAHWLLFSSTDDEGSPLKGFISVTSRPSKETDRAVKEVQDIPYFRIGTASWNDEEDFLSCKFIAQMSQRIFRGIQPWLGSPLQWQVWSYHSLQEDSINIASAFVDIFVLFHTGTGHLLQAGKVLNVLATSTGRLRFLCFPVLPNDPNACPAILGLATPQHAITLPRIPFVVNINKKHANVATFELQGKLPPKEPKDGYRIMGIPIAMEVIVY